MATVNNGAATVAPRNTMRENCILKVHGSIGGKNCTAERDAGGGVAIRAALSFVVSEGCIEHQRGPAVIHQRSSKAIARVVFGAGVTTYGNVASKSRVDDD